MKKALTIALLLVVGTTTLWARGDTTIINTDRTIVVESNLCIRVRHIYYQDKEENRESLEFCINDSICSEMELPNIEDVKNFDIDSIYCGWCGVEGGGCFPGGSDVRESTCNAREPSLIPGSGRSPREENGNPLLYLAWRIPWTEESSGLQSIGLQRVRHD